VVTPDRPVPAYSITEVEVLDREAFSRYRELAAAAVSRYGGRFLVRGAEPVVAEGQWPSGQRVNIIEFPSMEQLTAWYNSPEYAPARDIAQKALRRRLLFVDGSDTPRTTR
jgi:uncharacterized protein (DUF1330 family)